MLISKLWDTIHIVDRTASETMDLDQKKEITKKCSKNLINAAKSFLSDGNLHAAEQFTLIAEGLGYDDEIDAILAEIQAEKQKRNSREEDQENADKYFSKDDTAHSKCEDTARKPSETASEDFENKTLEQPQLLHAESNPSKLTEQKKDVDTSKFEEMNTENDPKDYLQPKPAAQSVGFEAAEVLIRLGEEAMKDGDFKKAVKFVLAAERSCSTDNGQKLLQKLLSSTPNFESKDTNLNIDYDDANSGEHGVKYSSVVKGEGNYEKPQYVSNIEPARSGEHRIYRNTVSTSEKTITIRTTDSTPTSRDFPQEPTNDVCKNKPRKFTDSVTTVYRGIARECFKRGDFKGTEYYLTKAQEHQFSSRVEKMLMQIKELNTGTVYPQSEMRALESEFSEGQSSSSNDTDNEAENYLKRAQFALTAKKYEKAEELLLKAQKLRPSSVRQKALLADVREARAAAEGSRNRPHVVHSKKDQPSKNMHGSNTSSEVHVPEANKRKMYYQKEDELRESSTHFCHTCGAHDYPDDVKNHKGSVSVGVDVNKKEAETCFKRAQCAFAAQDYDTAEQLVLEAQNWYPSDKATEFLENIRVAKTENDVNCKDIPKGTQTLKTNVNNFETLEDSKRIAEQCTEKAREAMSRGNFEKAKRMLLRAERFSTTEQARELLDQVQRIILNESKS